MMEQSSADNHSHCLIDNADLLTIDRGKERGQTIRQMEEIKVALYEVGNEEPPFWVYSYDKCLLKDAVALELGSLIRVSNQWKFEVSGIGYAEDLEFFVSKYYDGEVLCLH